MEEIMHHLLLLHPGALGKFNVEHTHNTLLERIVIV